MQTSISQSRIFLRPSHALICLMRFLILVPLFLLAAATAKPFDSEDELVVTREFFLESDVKYTSQHDIVNVVVPLNRINFNDDDEDDDTDCQDVTVFFVEADVNDKGERVDRGLYTLKKDKATNILANGRDAAAFNDGTKKVYLGASDGIYVYDGTNATTEKYGSLIDSIIQIEADNHTGLIYFVTDNHEVFSVADEGTKKNKVEQLKDVKEIVFDFNSNLYYYDAKKELYVFNQNGVKKIEGIPRRNEVKLIRPMFDQEDGVFALVDDTLYLLKANGSAVKTGITFQVKPTAYAPEATLIHYYALNKKLYEFNVIAIVRSELSKLKDFLKDKTNEIQTIATMSRSSFGAQKIKI